eukprot:TRINITY_DN13879_c0_g2_i10.p2 TRINITY_DN13879_c0_g2~~TRINITY_DN13879_c0_g2_i10.p2  ORF type:complete len:252 (+),score=12.30 TRINITY_DN13879_c0_g2_i10:727-1482(+)
MMRIDRKYKREFFQIMKISVIGGLLDREKVKLGANLDHGISREVHMRHGVFAPNSYDRVSCVAAWVESLLIRRLKSGGFNVPGPLVSHLFTVMSEGMLAFEHCRKLNHTPFPFPWAQMVLILMLLHMLTVPVMICAFIRDTYIAIVLSFMAVQTYWALNEVARELEDPFMAPDPNDIPFTQLQLLFNERIIAYYNSVGNYPGRSKSSEDEDSVENLTEQYLYVPIYRASPNQNNDLSQRELSTNSLIKQLE